MLSLARRLASNGLREGVRYRWTMFDPATMRNAPVEVVVGRRELVRADDRPLPAFRVELSFAGLQTTSWVTDTGEVIREESPMGLLTVAETEERAMSMAVPRQVQLDLLEAAAIVPQSRHRIDNPRDVQRLRLRLEGADLSSPDLQGSGQTVDGNVIEIADARTLRPEPTAAADAAAYLGPEPFIESDAAEIREEAVKALGSIQGARARAERLTRYVNALLDKKPTVSLPSALEVLRTRVGDCNEHTALYVALARASGIPARISVGLASVRNAFYYHAWPEVFVDEGHGTRPLAAGRSDLQPVPCRRDSHPARSRRAGQAGGDRAAHRPGEDHHPGPRPRAGQRPSPGGPAMIAVTDLVKQYGSLTAVDRVTLDVQPGQIHGFLGPNGAGKTTTIRMIAGLLKPTAGRILVNGHDLATEPDLAKASLGFIPDRPFVYEKLTAGEFLRFHGGLYGLESAAVDERITEMLELFELTRWRDELVESFSHGMKQRLVMGSAFMHRPRAVLVDEPMVGLDPRGARLIKDVFRRMAERGVAILMSTHTLEVAQEMCDRVSIILKGRIIASGTVDDVRRMSGNSDEQLTAVFLKLTGGSGLQEIDEVL